jgi:hypothetical protein
MKNLSILSILLFLITFISCKKGDDNNNIDDYSGNLPQAVFYRFIATKPSLADSALGRFRDSVVINFTRKIDSPDYLINYDFNRLNANLNDRFPGFSFGYQINSSQFPCFTFTKNAFPDVPYNFELNKAYELSVVNSQTSSIFLGTHNGDGGMNYFVNNVYPPDGTSPKFDFYVKVTFT